MRTKQNVLLLWAVVVISALLVSCDKEEGDTTPPVINLIAPAEGATLAIGSEHGIHFDMELSDNEMLASYKVDIHNYFDGHGHDQLKSEENTTAFVFQKVWDVSGLKNTKIHHHEIVIPAGSTPGNYHLMVYCTDAAGNESYLRKRYYGE